MIYFWSKAVAIDGAIGANWLSSDASAVPPRDDECTAASSTTTDSCCCRGSHGADGGNPSRHESSFALCLLGRKEIQSFSSKGGCFWLHYGNVQITFSRPFFRMPFDNSGFGIAGRKATSQFLLTFRAKSGSRTCCYCTFFFPTGISTLWSDGVMDGVSASTHYPPPLRPGKYLANIVYAPRSFICDADREKKKKKEVVCSFRDHPVAAFQNKTRCWPVANHPEINLHKRNDLAELWAAVLIRNKPPSPFVSSKKEEWNRVEISTDTCRWRGSNPMNWSPSWHGAGPNANASQA